MNHAEMEIWLKENFDILEKSLQLELKRRITDKLWMINEGGGWHYILTKQEEKSSDYQLSSLRMIAICYYWNRQLWIGESPGYNAIREWIERTICAINRTGPIEF